MKRWTVMLGALLLAPTLASADTVSISELRRQAEGMGRWTQAYEAYGRTIEVDVPILVPKVDRMPILTAEAYDAVENGALNRAEYPLKRLSGDGWSMDYEDSGLFSFLDHGENGVGVLSIPDRSAQNDSTYLNARYNSPEDKRTHKMKYTSVFFAPGNFDPAATFAEDNPHSLQDAMDCCEKVMEFFYPEEPDVFLDAVEVRSRDHKVKNLDDYKLGDYASGSTMGTYEIVIRQRMHGVPVYISAGRLLDTTRPSEGDNAVWMKLNRITALDAAFFEYRDDGSFWFVSAWLKEQDVAAEDVPLQSLDVVLSGIEEKIASGHIRNVYALKLGYCVYLDKDATERYMLYPVWVCECSYLENAREEMPQSPIWDQEDSVYANRFRNGYGYRPLLINAQTGVMDAAKFTKSEQAFCPEIVE